MRVRVRVACSSSSGEAGWEERMSQDLDPQEGDLRVDALDLDGLKKEVLLL